MNKADIPEWLKLEIMKTKPLSANLSPIQTYRIASKEIWEIISKPENLIKIEEVKALVEALRELETEFSCVHPYEDVYIPIISKALKPFQEGGSDETD